MRPYFENKTKQKLKTRLSRLLFGCIIRDYLIKKDYSLSYVHACCEDRRLYEELKFIKIILETNCLFLSWDCEVGFPFYKQTGWKCLLQKRKEREREVPGLENTCLFKVLECFLCSFLDFTIFWIALLHRKGNSFGLHLKVPIKWHFVSLRNNPWGWRDVHQLIPLVTHAEYQGSIPSTYTHPSPAHDNSQPFVTPVPGSSSDLWEHQLCTWYTYIYVGKIFTHIKKLQKRKKER